MTFINFFAHGVVLCGNSLPGRTFGLISYSRLDHHVDGLSLLVHDLLGATEMPLLQKHKKIRPRKFRWPLCPWEETPEYNF